MDRIDTRAQLLAAIHASWTTQAIAAAVELRLPDLLAEAPRDIQALAGATHCHAPSLQRLLVALVSLGLVTQRDGEGFALTASGAPLRSDAPGLVSAWAQLRAAHRVDAGPA
jgi:hypothetical protein